MGEVAGWAEAKMSRDAWLLLLSAALICLSRPGSPPLANADASELRDRGCCGFAARPCRCTPEASTISAEVLIIPDATSVHAFDQIGPSYMSVLIKAESSIENV